MSSGLLDMELKKLSDIIDQLHGNSLLLMNESFQTTTDDAAKELANEIVPALCRQKVKILFVTHLYGYAKETWDNQKKDALFLSPRGASYGDKQYQLREAEPSQSAAGTRLYDELLG